MITQQDKITASEVRTTLEERALALDAAASNTPSTFLRAIYQAQGQALREAAQAFNGR